MEKSVYSLVLSDRVVEAVDRMAYSLGSSRSALVNQILAESVSYVTPEKRMRDIFQSIEHMLPQSVFQVLMQPSDAMLSLRSVLSYKYNPSVRYSVELYRDGRENIGELRVSLRSQSSSLILYMSQFFRIWTQIEAAAGNAPDCALEDGRYTRVLRLPPGEYSPEELGEALARYIRAMDSAMKAFFSSLDDPRAAALMMERIYASAGINM